jgi:hypothetical protein
MIDGSPHVAEILFQQADNSAGLAERELAEIFGCLAIASSSKLSSSSHYRRSPRSKTRTPKRQASPLPFFEDADAAPTAADQHNVYRPCLSISGKRGPGLSLGIDTDTLDIGIPEPFAFAPTPAAAVDAELSALLRALDIGSVDLAALSDVLGVLELDESPLSAQKIHDRQVEAAWGRLHGGSCPPPLTACPRDISWSPRDAMAWQAYDQARARLFAKLSSAT